MFSSSIEDAIRYVEAGQITEIFMWVLVIVFALSLWWKRNEKHGGFTNYTPTLLTSIGILGTFTGIIAGLVDFDPGNIDGSISPLLEGLKTAFITSLSGMFLSIVFKAIVTSGVLNRTEDVIDDNELGVADLYKVMKQQADGIEQLKKAISENDESSLVGQVKLLRSDLSDNNKSVNQHLLLMAQAVTNIGNMAEEQRKHFKEFEDRLWIKLQDFADMLSKSATEQVVVALKQVIQEFNKNLVEQFGENFKQLNEAVYRLLEWQNNYKEQLADMKANYDLSVQALTKTETSITHISNETKHIPDTMNKLKTVMEVNQHQISELDRHLGAFKDIRDRAVESIPGIREQIDLAIAGAKAANDVLAKGMQENSKKMGMMFDESKEANSVFTKGIEQMRRSLEKTIKDQATQHRHQADKVFAGLEKSIENALSNTGESVQKQVDMIDKILGEEVEKVMTSMGNALASISGRFTGDYSKLVRQMSDIVNTNRYQA